MPSPHVQISDNSVQNSSNLYRGIQERRDGGFLVLSVPSPAYRRRVLFINSYGGVDVWEKVKRGQLPPHHMWGCIELVLQGYEVAIAEPIKHFRRRRPLPHDLTLFRSVRGWLRPDDIIYCGHTVLFWIPLLRKIGGLKCHLVTLTYAREELDFAKVHRGIAALTPAAADQARRMAPNAKVAHLGWGCDLAYFPHLPFIPRWLLSCGITHRDFPTLRTACERTTAHVQIICPGLPPGMSWPRNATVFDGGKAWNHEKSAITYQELFDNHYSGSIASLIILKNDPEERTAVGFTNMIEAMALARPIIATRTGALPSELDIEKQGCGIFVPPNNPGALADALTALSNAPEKAREMGCAARRLAESHYNIQRFARDLHRFFEAL